MAEGVRIRHHTRRSELLPVPLLHKPFPVVQSECGLCLRRLGISLRHPCKTVHVELDDEGCVIVSKEIWADFRKVVNNAGFTVANPVKRPPAQVWTPEFIEMKTEAIDLGGDLAKTNGHRTQYFTPGLATNPEAQPMTRTVGMDEYLRIANEHGLTDEQALNALLAALIKETN